MTGKIVLSMKNPDCVSWAVDEFVKETGQDRDKVINAISKWVEYEEYVYVEIDLEKGTATVLEVEDE